ncbi:MAG: family 10 glycosylhydrolase [Bacteroidaceae bacterium]|nr:family 10 glycosylhydrolase [Bacteroidaceae bacterium]
MRKIAIIIIFIAAFLAANAQNIYDVQYPKFEERAVWLATIGGIDWPRTKATDATSTERQKQELCSILDRLQQANINVVILQTRVRGSVIYPSDIETWDETITGRAGRAPSYDPLAFAIDECHRRGMELHAWLVSIPLGTSQRQKSYGSMSVTRTHPTLTKTVGGEVFMIPGQPGTADYIASIAREITEWYDIDGINLDYIRYPESSYRFNDDNLYKAASTSMTKAEWRRDNITRIVRRVHDEVKAVKPWVKLSSSPVGKYRSLTRYRSGGWDCYDGVYQDPQAWLRDNIQDMLFPMMYFLGDHYYPFLYNWEENRYGHPIVPGLGIYFLDPKEGRWQLNDVRAEMHAARDTGIGGIAFYRSEYLIRNFKGIYDATCDEFFPYPALTTPMTWSGHTDAPTQPTNLKYKDGIITWNYSQPTTNGRWPIVHFNIYGSNIYPVDITSPENLLAQRIPQTQYTIAGRALTKSFYAVTAVDRFGNESAPIQEVSTITERPSRDAIIAAVRRHFAGTAAVDEASSKKTKKEKTQKVKTPKTTKVKTEKPAKVKEEKVKTEKTKTEKSEKKKTEVRTVDFSKYLD